MQNPFEAITTKLDEIQKSLSKLTQSAEGPADDEVLNIEEACRLLHLSKQTLYNKVNRREIPVFKKGKRLYFSKNSLLKWIQAGKVKTRQEIREEGLNDLREIKKRGEP